MTATPYSTLPEIRGFRMVDVVNNSSQSWVRVLAFAVFALAIIAICYFQMMLGDGVYSDSRIWLITFALLGVVGTMIGVVARIDAGSFVWWTRRNLRRGFDVIFKRKSK